jgi:lysozyme
MMQTSDRGKVALALHEGIVPAPYLDSVGVWTVYIGHAETSGLAPNPRTMPKGMPADLDGAIREAFRVFGITLARYEDAVRKALKVPVQQHEFDALVSFHYNTGGIARASITRNLNAGDRKAAAESFMGWLRPPEIRGRREAEQRLFRDGVYPAGAIPVYDVTASNKPGRVVRRVLPGEALAILAASAATPLTPKPVADSPAPQTDSNDPLRTFLCWLSAIFARRP